MKKKSGRIDHRPDFIRPVFSGQTVQFRQFGFSQLYPYSDCRAPSLHPAIDVSFSTDIALIELLPARKTCLDVRLIYFASFAV